MLISILHFILKGPKEMALFTMFKCYKDNVGENAVMDLEKQLGRLLQLLFGASNTVS